MRKAAFYPRFAAQSIRKNGKFYLPYLLTCMGSAAMFYIMLYLQGNEGLREMRGAAYVSVVLALGSIIIAIFSAIVLFYTNGFLMKRRQKELGLYSILGMEKRHIGHIMFWETLYSALAGIIGGLIIGLLLSKLLLLLLCSLLHFAVPFGFEINFGALGITAIVFCAIFALNLFANLRRVGKSKPIELLYSGNTAETEPKSRWFLTVVGVVTLGVGYGIALVVKNPLSALLLFFVAVLFVIIGTYCLFVAGSIAVLKGLRKNKAYYYQARHFTTVSGMLHRMKRNAAGLASICILSTMVLVTVSSTLCLYLGAEDALDSMYPNDVSFSFWDAGEGTVEKSAEIIETMAQEKGVALADKSISAHLQLSLSLSEDGTELIDEGEYSSSYANYALGYFITTADYERATGKSVTLAPGEVLAQSIDTELTVPQSFTLMGMDMTVREYIDDFPDDGEISMYMASFLCFVVNEQDLLAIDAAQKLDSEGDKANSIGVTLGYDLGDMPTDEQTAFVSDSFDALGEQLYGDVETGPLYTYSMMSSSCRAERAEEFYTMYGGFFFLGIFLGLLFLMATALIIYYKQVSEGYEDADRFRIMQQVGMSEKEVRGSIKSQIVTIFLLPIAAAAVHIAAAFQMITRLLTIFSLYNVPLFALCCAITLALFALIYFGIYALTAKAYYKIVKA